VIAIRKVIAMKKLLPLLASSIMVLVGALSPGLHALRKVSIWSSAASRCLM